MTERPQQGRLPIPQLDEFEKKRYYHAGEVSKIELVWAYTGQLALMAGERDEHPKHREHTEELNRLNAEGRAHGWLRPLTAEEV